MKTVLCCEDSLEGILCGVYEGWAGKYGHASVALALGNPGQQELFVRYVQVPTETEPAQKVYRTVLRVMGEEACEQMELAAMSHREDKGTAIYQLIVSGFHMAQPGRVMEALTLPGVQRVTELAGSVWKEAHHLMGFVRFAESREGTLVAFMQPKAQLLPVLAPHFADRLPGENWVIVDVAHGQLAVHQRQTSWVLLLDAALAEQMKEVFAGEERLSEEELLFGQLWKEFCSSIAIAGRNNPALQNQLLPVRFRPFMTEFCEKY